MSFIKHVIGWVSQETSKLYAFDLDDNVIYTNAKIRTCEMGRIDTRTYAKFRDSVTLGVDAFKELLDVQTCELYDAPCLTAFCKALKKNSPVAIITARSNEEKDIRLLLSRKISDTNLENVHIYCCNSLDFITRFNAEHESTQERKSIALQHFLSLYPYATSLGFSDDDDRNLTQVHKLFVQLKKERPDVNFCLYQTSTGETRKQTVKLDDTLGYWPIRRS